MASIEAYTDGSCIKGGKGGWGWMYLFPLEKITIRYQGSGRKAGTTNQEMELKAMLELVRNLPLSGNVTIYSDSQYVLKGIIDPKGSHTYTGGPTGWVRGWKKNGWRTAGGAPVKYKEIWEGIIVALDGRKGSTTLKWVEGHSGDPGNEYVDKLATTQSASLV